MRSLRCHARQRWVAAAALCMSVMPLHASPWLPITADELTMTEEPQAPKAAAIILYRQVDRDDTAPMESDYVRVKVLSEEGRQYGNVEITYDRNRESISQIEARTIQPDGSVADFEGTIFDRRVVEGQGTNLHAKAFALPDVRIGSIIEYRYTQRLASGYVYGSHWILSQPLFTKDGRFSLQPSRQFGLRYSWPLGLPEGTNPPAERGGTIRLEVHNLAPFVREEHEPPDHELQYRVDFIYVAHEDMESDPVKFWKAFAISRCKKANEFVDNRHVMEQAVAEIVAPDDTPDAKLRKLYARVQQLRNLSIEPKKTDQEKDRDREGDIKDAAQVWQRGAGTGQQLTLLLLGLLRAAGFQADPILVGNRDAVFFDPRVMNPAQLNTNLLLVLNGGKELFLDPGAAFTPFGTLPWGKTGVRGLVLDKNGGRWIDTPLPAPGDSRIEHTAELELTPAGALTGRLRSTYTGLEARACRMHERNEDETHRKQFLENLLKADAPAGVEVELMDEPDWDSADSPFIVGYRMTIPEWATLTGQRALMADAVFAGRWKHAFEHATRIHPIYFPFPFEYLDDVRIELPQGWEPASLPQPHEADINILGYHSSATMDGRTLTLKRQLASRSILVDSKYYESIRVFFQSVRTGDQEQLILSTRAAAVRP